MFYEKEREIVELKSKIENLLEKQPLNEYEVFFNTGEKATIKAHGFNERDGAIYFWKYPYETIGIINDYFSVVKSGH